jgi:hypothetical protein
LDAPSTASIPFGVREDADPVAGEVDATGSDVAAAAAGLATAEAV